MLKWPPAVFWGATPFEFWAALDGARIANGDNPYAAKARKAKDGEFLTWAMENLHKKPAHAAQSKPPQPDKPHPPTL